MEDAAAGIGGILSMFTGGALSRMAIFTLGIMPYISASIVMQLLGSMWEPLKNLKKEGEAGAPQAEPIHPLRHRGAGDSAGLWTCCQP